MLTFLLHSGYSCGKKFRQGNLPRLFPVASLRCAPAIHPVGDPGSHDEEPGDDHVRGLSCTGKGCLCIFIIAWIIFSAKYILLHVNIAGMKHFGTVILVLFIAFLISAGCTQPAPSPQPVTMTATPALPAVTPVTTVTTSAPQVVVTVIHYIAPTSVWKDSEHHFTLAVPQTWEMTTRRESLPDGSQGLIFTTGRANNDNFSITTYPISLGGDQTYRNTFRTWDPAPAESTVTLNNIVFDRFESTKDGKTHVGYVAQKASANDLGFSSVIVYTADQSHPFEKEDFDTIVSSFAYFTKDQEATMPGLEIPRVR